MKNDGSRLGKRFADLLEPDESFVAAATVNTGSITRAAFGGVISPSIKLGLTHRRMLMFSTTQRGFYLKAERFLQAIPLTDVASVESSTGSVVGVNHIKIGMTLKDGSALAFEAVGFTFKAAKELASALEDVVS